MRKLFRMKGSSKFTQNGLIGSVGNRVHSSTKRSSSLNSERVTVGMDRIVSVSRYPMKRDGVEWFQIGNACIDSLQYGQMSIIHFTICVAYIYCIFIISKDMNITSAIGSSGIKPEQSVQDAA